MPRRSDRPSTRGGRDAARRTGRSLRRAAEGDRPYALALFGLVVLLIAMALGPLQSLSAAQDRVDGLAGARKELQSEVDDLEDRREVLQDPEALELMAREQLGLVMPGEIPFVVVTPEDELATIGPETPAGEQRSLWDRLRTAVTDLFG